MKVIGEAEEGDWLFIIPEDSLEAEWRKPNPVARVLCRSEKWLMRPVSLYSLFKQGNFDPSAFPDTDLPALLADLKRVDGPGVNDPWLPTPWSPPDSERRRFAHLHAKEKRG